MPAQINPPEGMNRQAAAVYFNNVRNIVENDIEDRRAINAMQFTAQMGAVQALGNAVSQGFDNMMRYRMGVRELQMKEREVQIQKEAADSDRSMRIAQFERDGELHKLNREKAQLEITEIKRRGEAKRASTQVIAGMSAIMTPVQSAATRIAQRQGTKSDYQAVRQAGDLAMRYRQDMWAKGLDPDADVVGMFDGLQKLASETGKIVANGRSYDVLELYKKVENVDNPSELMELHDVLRNSDLDPEELGTALNSRMDRVLGSVPIKADDPDSAAFRLQGSLVADPLMAQEIKDRRAGLAPEDIQARERVRIETLGARVQALELDRTTDGTVDAVALGKATDELKSINQKYLTEPDRARLDAVWQRVAAAKSAVSQNFAKDFPGYTPDMPASKKVGFYVNLLQDPAGYAKLKLSADSVPKSDRAVVQAITKAVTTGDTSDLASVNPVAREELFPTGNPTKAAQTMESILAARAGGDGNPDLRRFQVQISHMLPEMRVKQLREFVLKGDLDPRPAIEQGELRAATIGSKLKPSSVDKVDTWFKGIALQSQGIDPNKRTLFVDPAKAPIEVDVSNEFQFIRSRGVRKSEKTLTSGIKFHRAPDVATVQRETISRMAEYAHAAAYGSETTRTAARNAILGLKKEADSVYGEQWLGQAFSALPEASRDIVSTNIRDALKVTAIWGGEDEVDALSGLAAPALFKIEGDPTFNRLRFYQHRADGRLLFDSYPGFRNGSPPKEATTVLTPTPESDKKAVENVTI